MYVIDKTQLMYYEIFLGWNLHCDAEHDVTLHLGWQFHWSRQDLGSQEQISEKDLRRTNSSFIHLHLFFYSFNFDVVCYVAESSRESDVTDVQLEGLARGVGQ